MGQTTLPNLRVSKPNGLNLMTDHKTVASMHSSAILFRARSGINPDKGKQPKEHSQDTIAEQVRETVSTSSINVDNLHKRVELFREGQVKHHLPFWESLTNDPVILDNIKHHHKEFEAEYPTQTVRPNKIYFSTAEIRIIDEENCQAQE